MSSIKLSPKYGLNPAMTVCFWCGKETGVALLGKVTKGERGGDYEAPRYVFSGYEPCEKCVENMEKGVVLMEADTIPVFAGQPEMQKGVFPTGNWLVLEKDAAKRILDCDSDKVFLDKKMFDWLYSSYDIEAHGGV